MPCRTELPRDSHKRRGNDRISSTTGLLPWFGVACACHRSFLDDNQGAVVVVVVVGGGGVVAASLDPSFDVLLFL